MFDIGKTTEERLEKIGKIVSQLDEDAPWWLASLLAHEEQEIRGIASFYLAKNPPKHWAVIYQALKLGKPTNTAMKINFTTMLGESPLSEPFFIEELLLFFEDCMQSSEILQYSAILTLEALDLEFTKWFTPEQEKRFRTLLDFKDELCMENHLRQLHKKEASYLDGKEALKEVNEKTALLLKKGIDCTSWVFVF